MPEYTQCPASFQTSRLDGPDMLSWTWSEEMKTHLLASGNLQTENRENHNKQSQSKAHFDRQLAFYVTENSINKIKGKRKI